MRPIGIDLFAGAGGMSLGFEQAGFDVVAAVEIDPIHSAVHKFNFPTTAILPYSVTDVSAAKIRLAAGIGNKRIDCVFGGAPCQGFSMIGQRALDDPRNKLVLEFVRIVKELDAETFVFENVKGLTLGKHKQVLHELKEAFNAVGYDVRLPWQVLNASHYNVPQNRERLFLIGAKKGSSLAQYPDPITNTAGKKKHIINLPDCPSCFDALKDLPDAETFQNLKKSDVQKIKNWASTSIYASELRCEDDNGWHLGYKRRWNPVLMTSSARTEHTVISRRRFRDTSTGKVEPISRLFKLPANGVSNTLRAGTDGSRGAFTSPRPIHYKYDRCVTVREMARLHGFPDWFRFHATKWHGARQIGNAVPPPLARAVAVEITRSFSMTIDPPKEVLDLGDETLLKLTNKSAAEFFGVKPPISKRDRKSGATKRKQVDIENEQLKLRAKSG